jgi:aminoglycoside phosphotransferase (APT) family kinase protein
MMASPETGTALLREHLDPHANWVTRVLSQTDQQRRVVEYRTRNGNPTQRVVGKFYDDDTGAHAYAAMQTLCQQLPQLSVLGAPCPLFYSVEHRFLAQPYVEGIPYSDLLTSDRFNQFLAQAGAALATLHAQPAPSAPAQTIRNHIFDLIHPHPETLTAQLPEYRAQIESIMQEMLRQERTWQIAPAPLHRDFHLRQLFYEEGCTWLIDWDLFQSGDPALDVGNFVVYLKTHLLKIASPSAVQAFLQGYFDQQPDSLLARLPVYQSLTYLRMACKHFRFHQVSWREKVRMFLNESTACLEKRGRTFMVGV